jgi:hypothetical protein
MAADPKQLRAPARQADPIDSQFYTASLSAYLQGAEIVQFYQLVNYTNPKIRGNTSPVSAISGSSQGWLSTGENTPAFNDTLSPENRGTLITRKIDVYTPGRDPALGPTGQSSYITFVTSGSQGFVPSGSVRSQANLDVQGRLDTYISHYIEQRDLGQTNFYSDGNPFEESDIVENSPPAFLLGSHPEAFVFPTSLVQVCSSPSSFDGVIEAQDIRRVADRSSIDLPFIIRGPKGALSVSDDNQKSYQFSDTFDLRQIGGGLTSAPYLDYVSIFGSGQALIDQPGAFSDAQENLSSFTDTARIEGAYPSGTIDATFRSLFLSGTISGSVQVKAPDTNWFPTYLVAARHGFVFSQNDNYGYDSIAFGGLKK